MDETKARSITYAAVALILALGLIISFAIATNGFVKVKGTENSITVTGSAKKQIKSDLIVWDGTFSTNSPSMSDAYKQLTASREKVKNYLKNQGVNNSEIVYSSINTNIINQLLPNGSYSNTIDHYQLTQTVSIRSKDVEKITELSRQATDLINEGVELQSMPPQYFYTKIADLKVEMLAQATKDARTRAEQICDAAGSNVGGLRNAKMGVIQITPLYSTETSDSGVNDTSSLDKEITAVISCQFEIK